MLYSRVLKVQDSQIRTFLFFPAAYWNVDVDWPASTFLTKYKKSL